MSAEFSEILGGITAPQGFVAGAIECGVKPGGASRLDVGLLYCREPAVAAATFTTNKIRAAPVRVSQAHLRSRSTRAIVANSGNANACTGAVGICDAKRMVAATAAALGLREREVMVCSTGRIGVPLPMLALEAGIARLPAALQGDGSLKMARAIMTSDTFPKELAVEVEIGGVKIRLGGIAKGAGMIDPNMATMLCFVTTDAVIAKGALQQALSFAVEHSFNRICIDGDMSTNDSVIALASGLAGNAPLAPGSAAFLTFRAALLYVTSNLARMIVEDGEGVTKFVELQIRGAASASDARKVARAVAQSTLVKCAWFGSDPNWGRLMDALGYAGAKIREEMIDIFYDGVIAVKNGVASETPFAKLQAVAAKERLTITIDLRLGSGEYTAFTTDLSTRYVELNMGE